MAGTGVCGALLPKPLNINNLETDNLQACRKNGRPAG
jgi:hypothetical protein